MTDERGPEWDFVPPDHGAEAMHKLDWDRAKEWLAEMRVRYTPIECSGMGLESLVDRYLDGERTEELHREIMELE